MSIYITRRLPGTTLNPVLWDSEKEKKLSYTIVSDKTSKRKSEEMTPEGKADTTFVTNQQLPDLAGLP